MVCLFNPFSSLSELLDQDMTSYEYFHSLPPEMQKDIREQDLASFNELKDYVERHRGFGGKE